jgi:hypothetical protein
MRSLKQEISEGHFASQAPRTKCEPLCQFCVS